MVEAPPNPQFLALQEPAEFLAAVDSSRINFLLAPAV
jgi:hypothetical protein